MTSGRECAIDGCEKDRRCRGLCPMHYRRLQRTGDAGEPAPRYIPGRGCLVPGCEGKHNARGYCKNHWRPRDVVAERVAAADAVYNRAVLASYLAGRRRRLERTAR